jgi:hypothetical protein
MDTIDGNVETNLIGWMNKINQGKVHIQVAHIIETDKEKNKKKEGEIQV